MLSIGKLAGGAEDYYLRAVAGGREEYYTGAGEASGYWVGWGTVALGLSGPVGASQLRVLLAGFSPDGGRISSRPPGTARVAGFDLTFSAPKSVSVLWALADPEVGEAVRRAHDVAVEDALGYLERHATKARRGAGGDERIGASGLVGACFRHRSSRAGDPQLHSHLLVVNAVLADDGRWSAPDARLLYFHARAAGSLYQASLRAGLVGGLGVGFGPVEKGCAEIAGIDEAVLRAFSSRRQAIETALQDRGLTSRRAAELVALETRPKKASGQDLPAAGLHQHWRERAGDLGFDAHTLHSVLVQPRLAYEAPDLGRELAVKILGANGLTAQQSVFERRDLVRAVAEALPEGATVAVIERQAERILGGAEIVHLGVDGAGGEALLTTTELLSIEQQLLAEASGRRASAVGVVEAAVTDAAIAARPWLTDEQEALVRSITMSGDGVEAVVGKAGSGKTQALEAARAAWQAGALEVIGTALSARAAAELQARSTIPTDTVAGLLARFDRAEEVFSNRQILVVDEAAMVGTRVLARVIEAAGAAGAKVVLIGDHRQLPEIEAGGAFAALVGRLQPITLRANRRQSEEWERRTLDQLRSGSVAKALDEYLQRGRLHILDSATSARRAVVHDWLEASTQGTAIMLAARRVEVDELNSLARDELHRRGRLGPDVFLFGSRSFAFGDEVICLRNDRLLGVRNGSRGVVSGASAGALCLQMGEGERQIPMAYVEGGWLTYGYATTIHKSQGSTVDYAFVLDSGSLYREATYVAMSRARARTDLYMTEGAFRSLPRRGNDLELLDELGRTMAQSRAKRLASSYSTSRLDQLHHGRDGLVRPASGRGLSR